MVGNQHADAAVPQMLDDPLDVQHGDRVDPRKGLVEEDEAGVGGERPRDLHPSPLTAGQGEPGPGPDMSLHFLGVMADELGLTVEQEESINSLINQSKLDSAVDRERLSQLRDELKNLSQAEDSFDSSSASVLAEELAEIVARTALAGAETRWQVRQVLTPEQRAQLDEWRGARFRGRHRMDAEDSLTE